MKRTLILLFFVSLLVAPSIAQAGMKIDQGAKTQIKQEMIERIRTAPEIAKEYGQVDPASIQVTSFGHVMDGEQVVFTANMYYKAEGKRHITWIWYYGAGETPLEERTIIQLFQ